MVLGLACLWGYVILKLLSNLQILRYFFTSFDTQSIFPINRSIYLPKGLLFSLVPVSRRYFLLLF